MHASQFTLCPTHGAPESFLDYACGFNIATAYLTKRIITFGRDVYLCDVEQDVATRDATDLACLVSKHGVVELSTFCEGEVLNQAVHGDPGPRGGSEKYVSTGSSIYRCRVKLTGKSDYVVKGLASQSDCNAKVNDGGNPPPTDHSGSGPERHSQNSGRDRRERVACRLL